MDSSSSQSTSILSAKISFNSTSKLTNNNGNQTSDLPNKKDTSSNSISVDVNSCDGTCVSPLFSLLCDEIDTNKTCSNGGTCCIDRQPTVTTANSIPECLGSCIPTFLSGVCARPSELILKTSNCMTGTICCYFKDFRPASERPNVPPHLPPPPPPTPPPFLVLLNTPKPSPPNIHYFQRPSGQFGSNSVNHYSPNEQEMIANRKPVQVHPPSLTHVTTPPINSSSSANNQQNSNNNKPVLSPKKPLPTNEATKITLPGGPSYCPGPCIAPIFRFTCFGGNAIYPKFLCAKMGQVCCAPLADIDAFEANAIANNGIWKSPAISESPTEESSTSSEFNTTVAPIKRKTSKCT